MKAFDRKARNRWGIVLLLLLGLGNFLLRSRRELWFDEALTVLNFMMPLDLGQIYHSYLIPNNQIVYTMALKLWDGCYLALTPYVEHWRWLSGVAMAACVWLLWELRREWGGRQVVSLLVLGAFVVSVPFGIYSTAIRGYALSCLFITLALYGAWRMLRGESNAQQLQGAIFYFAGALLAVGTIPSNLLALAGVGMFALHWCGRTFWREKRFYVLLLIPFGAFLLFYGPIWRELTHAMALGEGWHDRWRALLFAWLVPLSVFCILLGALEGYLGNIVRFHRTGRVDLWANLGIWLLPTAAVLLLPTAPFPRVFFPLFPVWIVSLAGMWDSLLSWARYRDQRRNGARTRMLLVGGVTAVVLWGILTQLSVIFIAPEQWRSWGVEEREDDLLVPYYANRAYQPTAAVEALEKKAGAAIAPELFFSFESDPLPIFFYALSARKSWSDRIRCDVPMNQVKQLKRGSLVVLDGSATPESERVKAYEERLHGTLQPLVALPYHQIYRLK